VFVGGRVERLDGANPSNEEVNALLARHGGTPIEDRVPVIAYGSNAAPSQLRHKYDGARDAVFPVLAARVANVAIGFSRHVTRYGSIPATLVHAAGADTAVFVLFLDQPQLEILIATEGNYEHIELDGDRYPVVLAIGERLPATTAFVSKRGVLGVDGRAVTAQSSPSSGASWRRAGRRKPACTLPTLPDEIVALSPHRSRRSRAPLGGAAPPHRGARVGSARPNLSRRGSTDRRRRGGSRR
jgi:hypothetical protein